MCKSEPQISFTYGSGFSGNTFYMEINEEIINLSHNTFNVNEKQAKVKAKEIIKQRGIEYNKPIIFVWNGTL